VAEENRRHTAGFLGVVYRYKMQDPNQEPPALATMLQNVNSAMAIKVPMVVAAKTVPEQPVQNMAKSVPPGQAIKAAIIEVKQTPADPTSGSGRRRPRATNGRRARAAVACGWCRRRKIRCVFEEDKKCKECKRHNIDCISATTDSTTLRKKVQVPLDKDGHRPRARLADHMNPNNDKQCTRDPRCTRPLFHPGHCRVKKLDESGFEELARKRKRARERKRKAGSSKPSKKQATAKAKPTTMELQHTGHMALKPFNLPVPGVPPALSTMRAPSVPVPPPTNLGLKPAQPAQPTAQATSGVFEAQLAQQRAQAEQKKDAEQLLLLGVLAEAMKKTTKAKLGSAPPTVATATVAPAKVLAKVPTKVPIPAKVPVPAQTAIPAAQAAVPVQATIPAQAVMPVQGPLLAQAPIPMRATIAVKPPTPAKVPVPAKAPVPAIFSAQAKAPALAPTLAEMPAAAKEASAPTSAVLASFPVKAPNIANAAPKADNSNGTKQPEEKKST